MAGMQGPVLWHAPWRPRMKGCPGGFSLGILRYSKLFVRLNVRCMKAQRFGPEWFGVVDRSFIWRLNEHFYHSKEFWDHVFGAV